MFVENNISFLLYGQQGSGKSTMINKYVRSMMKDNLLTFLPMIIIKKKK